MKILIISPGKKHDHTIAEGVAEYEKRVAARLNLEWHLPSASDKDTEGEAILKTIKESDFVVLLDEHGTSINTQGLATLLNKHLQGGTKRIVFVIGGAYGVSSAVKDRAQATYTLSALTLPHMLVRLVLVEQLYRALSILEGGKYHHA